MLRLIALSMLFVNVFANASVWLLKANKRSVTVNLSSDVRLVCLQHETNSTFDQNNDIVQLEIIRIQRLNKNVWNNEAFIEMMDSDVTHITNPSKNKDGKGHIDRIFKYNNYLEYHWSVASEDSVGTFRCEVEGLNDQGYTQRKYSQEVKIQKITPTLDGLIAYSANLRKEFDARLLDDEFGLPYWPGGRYFLMSTDTGCPSTMNSYLAPGVVHIEATFLGQNRNRVPKHFPNDTNTSVGKTQICNYHFCHFPEDYAGVGIWPTGSYCIQRYEENGECPHGFQPGNITIHLASLTDLKVEKNFQDGMPFAVDPKERSIQTFFCCRNDSNVMRPIFLPSAKPFYLFRYGGACQKVLNMDEHRTSLLLYTDPSKADTKAGQNPDSTLNPLELHMCYYSKEEY